MSTLISQLPAIPSASPSADVYAGSSNVSNAVIGAPEKTPSSPAGGLLYADASATGSKGAETGRTTDAEVKKSLNQMLGNATKGQIKDIEKLPYFTGARRAQLELMLNKQADAVTHGRIKNWEQLLGEPGRLAIRAQRAGSGDIAGTVLNNLAGAYQQGAATINKLFNAPVLPSGQARSSKEVLLPQADAVVRKASKGSVPDVAALANYAGDNKAANRLRGEVNKFLQGSPGALEGGFKDWKHLLGAPQRQRLERSLANAQPARQHTVNSGGAADAQPRVLEWGRTAGYIGIDSGKQQGLLKLGFDEQGNLSVATAGEKDVKGAQLKQRVVDDGAGALGRVYKVPKDVLDTALRAGGYVSGSSEVDRLRRENKVRVPEGSTQMSFNDQDFAKLDQPKFQSVIKEWARHQFAEGNIKGVLIPKAGAQTPLEDIGAGFIQGMRGARNNVDHGFQQIGEGLSNKKQEGVELFNAVIGKQSWDQAHKNIQVRKDAAETRATVTTEVVKAAQQDRKRFVKAGAGLAEVFGNAAGNALVSAMPVKRPTGGALALPPKKPTLALKPASRSSVAPERPQAVVRPQVHPARKRFNQDVNMVLDQKGLSNISVERSHALNRIESAVDRLQPGQFEGLSQMQRVKLIENALGGKPPQIGGATVVPKPPSPATGSGGAANTSGNAEPSTTNQASPGAGSNPGTSGTAPGTQAKSPSDTVTLADQQPPTYTPDIQPQPGRSSPPQVKDQPANTAPTPDPSAKTPKRAQTPSVYPHSEAYNDLVRSPGMSKLPPLLAERKINGEAGRTFISNGDDLFFPASAPARGAPARRSGQAVEKPTVATPVERSTRALAEAFSMNINPALREILEKLNQNPASMPRYVAPADKDAADRMNNRLTNTLHRAGINTPTAAQDVLTIAQALNVNPVQLANQLILRITEAKTQVRNTSPQNPLLVDPAKDAPSLQRGTRYFSDLLSQAVVRPAKTAPVSVDGATYDVAMSPKLLPTGAHTDLDGPWAASYGSKGLDVLVVNKDGSQAHLHLPISKDIVGTPTKILGAQLKKGSASVDVQTTVDSPTGVLLRKVSVPVTTEQAKALLDAKAIGKVKYVEGLSARVFPDSSVRFFWDASDVNKRGGYGNIKAPQVVGNTFGTMGEGATTKVPVSALAFSWMRSQDVGTLQSVFTSGLWGLSDLTFYSGGSAKTVGKAVAEPFGLSTEQATAMKTVAKALPPLVESMCRKYGLSPQVEKNWKESIFANADIPSVLLPASVIDAFDNRDASTHPGKQLQDMQADIEKSLQSMVKANRMEGFIELHHTPSIGNDQLAPYVPGSEQKFTTEWQFAVKGQKAMGVLDAVVDALKKNHGIDLKTELEAKGFSYGAIRELSLSQTLEFLEKQVRPMIVAHGKSILGDAQAQNILGKVIVPIDTYEEQDGKLGGSDRSLVGAATALYGAQNVIVVQVDTAGGKPMKGRDPAFQVENVNGKLQVVRHSVNPKGAHGDVAPTAYVRSAKDMGDMFSQALKNQRPITAEELAKVQSRPGSAGASQAAPR